MTDKQTGDLDAAPASPVDELLPANLENLLLASTQYLEDAILITEAEPIDEPGPRIVWVNDALYRMTGYNPDEIIGQSPRMLQGPLTDRNALDKIRYALERWQPVRVETVNYRKDGSPYWVEFQIVPIANEAGWYTHWISVQRDITERKAAEDQLLKMAHYDSLTQLPKRHLLEDRLQLAISQAMRYSKQLAVVFIDLDGFKQVNDKYGHHVGDQLLLELSTRMKRALREVDTLARLGGDEFVALVPDMDWMDEVSPILERLLAAASSVCSIDGFDIQVSASLGVSSFPQRTEVSVGQLIEQADFAMYRAKAAGKNRFHIYSDEE